MAEVNTYKYNDQEGEGRYNFQGIGKYPGVGKKEQQNGIKKFGRIYYINLYAN